MIFRTYVVDYQIFIEAYVTGKDLIEVAQFHGKIRRLKIGSEIRNIVVVKGKANIGELHLHQSNSDPSF